MLNKVVAVEAALFATISRAMGMCTKSEKSITIIIIRMKLNIVLWFRSISRVAVVVKHVLVQNTNKHFMKVIRATLFTMSHFKYIKLPYRKKGSFKHSGADDKYNVLVADQCRLVLPSQLPIAWGILKQIRG